MAGTTELGNGNVRNTVESFADKTGLDRKALEDQLNALQEQVAALRQSLSEKGKEVAAQVSDTAKVASERTSSTIRDYPLAAVLGAAAIGAALALLSREAFTPSPRRVSSYIPEDLISDLGHRHASLKSRVM